jgi:hypothetical protein
MQPISATRRAGFALALLALLLSACLLAPGRFASTLDLRRDGSFAFTYRGEIHMLALSKLAGELGAEDGKFTPDKCLKPGSTDERPCTAKEIATQKQSWEADRARSADKRRQDAEGMKAMLGGIDPSSPRAAEELAQRLRRQAGWKRVDYKGDGLFDVDFAISGRLDHDFVFPTIERFPAATAFVQLARRADGTVRIDAPGFAPATSGDPFRGFVQGIGGLTPGAESRLPLPMLDGRFTLRTDGTILANNTDEGPQPDAAGQRLEWAVNPRTASAPTALVRLER